MDHFLRACEKLILVVIVRIIFQLEPERETERGERKREGRESGTEESKRCQVVVVNQFKTPPERSSHQYSWIICAHHEEQGREKKRDH
jgi:hypothetical protein